MKHKTIAFISSSAVTIKNFRGPLISELVQQGHVVYALAPDFTEATLAGATGVGAIPLSYRMTRAGIKPISDLRALFQLRKILRVIRPDISFAYFIKPVIYGTVAARLARVPCRFAMIEGGGFVFTDDEDPNLPRRLLRGLATILYRYALRYARRVFVLNPDDAREFVARRMAGSDQVIQIHGIGVDLQHYSPKPPMLSPVRFLLVGRLLKQKGVGEYVAAARRIKETYPHTQFLLVGETDVNPSSFKLQEVAQWCQDGTIEWPGGVSDVRPWIRQASVFILPSYREGLPRSTMEAMAMARAVITTDAVGCRETVRDGVNGFLIPIRDVDALVEAMERFILNPGLIETMGLESRRMAEERFDVRGINRQILNEMGL